MNLAKEQRVLTVGSLFSGVGGIEKGLEDTGGFKTVWQVEIKPSCNAVRSRHWPDVQRYDDVTKFTLATNPVRPDLICGGFPCQDLSVAGKRAGLAGKRSGLFHEFMRIVSERTPRWVLVENVPGLLSSNEGRDMGIVLDTLEELGYIVDVDILNAQFFGVAQRRRRVFCVCQHRDDLLKQKTTSSAQTIVQCFAEILLSILAEARIKSESGPDGSGLESRFSIDGLQRRIKLFGMQSVENCEMLLDNLVAEVARFPTETKLSVWIPGESEVATGSDEAMLFENTSTVWHEWSTAQSWRTILNEILDIAKLCITSTASRMITEEKIFTCAKTSLNMLAFTALSNRFCPSYWMLASSVSIAVREFINYARSTSESLFTYTHWVCAWRDFLREASDLRIAIGRAGIWDSAAEVLFESESLPWNPAPSREAGARVAASLTRGAESSDYHEGTFEKAEVARPLTTSADRSRAAPIAYQCHGSNVGPMGTVRAGNGNETGGVPFVFKPRIGRNDRGQPSPIVNTLKGSEAGDTSDMRPCVVTGGNDGLDTKADGRSEPLGEATFQAENQIESRVRPLRSGSSDYRVRRLTPKECERLQGFPDDWTRYGADGKEISDSARYRMIGNAVCVPVARWIGERILEAES